jgi:hypothetical protein
MKIYYDGHTDDEVVAYLKSMGIPPNIVVEVNEQQLYEIIEKSKVILTFGYEYGRSSELKDVVVIGHPYDF